MISTQTKLNSYLYLPLPKKLERTTRNKSSYLVHKCKCHCWEDTGRCFDTCRRYDSPDRRCREDRVQHTALRPNPLHTHTVLSTGDTCTTESCIDSFHCLDDHICLADSDIYLAVLASCLKTYISLATYVKSDKNVATSLKNHTNFPISQKSHQHC